jgi:UDP-3-O-[3-hydroxymyristoyl] N-acetylglucosamine deacetylase
VFRRVDLPEPVDIPVSALAVTDTRLASTISNGFAKVHTVEHLMSACAGLGYRQPVMWTSRQKRCPSSMARPRPFVFLLQSAGIALQNAPKRFIRVLAPWKCARVRVPTLKWARLEPFHGYKLSFEIDFHHPAVDSTGQRVEFDMGADSYAATSRVRARLVLRKMWK